MLPPLWVKSTGPLAAHDGFFPPLSLKWSAPAKLGFTHPVLVFSIGSIRASLSFSCHGGCWNPTAL